MLQKTDAVVVMWIKNDKEKQLMIATPRQIAVTAQFEPTRWTFVVFWDDMASVQQDDVGMSSDDDVKPPSGDDADNGDPPAPFPPSDRPRPHSDPDMPMDQAMPEQDISDKEFASEPIQPQVPTLMPVAEEVTQPMHFDIFFLNQMIICLRSLLMILRK